MGENIFSDKYKIIDRKKYNDVNTTFLCLNCKNIFKNSIHHVGRPSTKGACPFCEVTTKRVTQEQAEYKLKAINEDYKIIKFNGMAKKSVLIHSCGATIEAPIERIIRRNTGHCIECSHMSRPYTTEFVKEEISNLTNDEYTVIGEYHRENEPIDIQHNVCGTIWKVRRRNFVCRNTRCPECSSRRSKAIEYIMSTLDTYNITYEKEKKFNNCKNKKELPFDIYIEKLNLIIEYDGEQHFHGLPYAKNYLEKLKKTHENDIKKNNFALSNSINILRISYLHSYPMIKNIIDDVLLYLKNEKSISDFNKYTFVYFNNNNDDYYKNNGYILMS